MANFSLNFSAVDCEADVEAGMLCTSFEPGVPSLQMSFCEPRLLQDVTGCVVFM